MSNYFFVINTYFISMKLRLKIFFPLEILVYFTTLLLPMQRINNSIKNILYFRSILIIEPL